MKRFLLFFLLVFLPLFAERPSSYPYVSGDTFRSFSDFIFDETDRSLNPAEIGEGQVVFVKTDYLEEFFNLCHPQIKYPYVLVTHNSDWGIPGSYTNYLNDSKLLAWFGQNMEGCHPKLHPIPIGIANQYVQHGDLSTLEEIRKTVEKVNRRPILLYMNFQTATYPQERKKVHSLFSDKPFCSVMQTTDFRSYLVDLSRSKFVLSPRGNGLDCHRTWEALLMGAIPIVKSSSLDPLFKDLPVLIVKDWNVINESFLLRQWVRMSLNKYNNEKLFADYWFSVIKSHVPTPTN